MFTVMLSVPSQPRLIYPLWRYVAIAASSAPLIAALSIGLFGMSLPLPPCQFQVHFGFPSPSCGLTRSFLALVRGDLKTAMQFHAFGPLIFAGFLTILTTAVLELRSRRSLMKIYAFLLNWRGLVLITAIYLGYYFLRLWVRYGAGDLPWGLDQTALWQFVKIGAKAL
ncbi:DUF2752 domain-containing protein [Leptolyngbya sp. PCC 6406]|uniref:DUF2752 domain-containing protein n=1 Tax=Leptolyngbya sp. PCC 6406 TaxID=1173264 RepID=UPI001CEDE6C2|nr:DUF2752 domain-containing protein [Leptolyngbya sp. PCC 6406]